MGIENDPISETAGVKNPPVTRDAPPDYRLAISPVLGMPPYVLDPADLSDCFRPFPDTAPRILAQNEHTLIKYGERVRLEEAEAMDFVSKNTSIVCPKVIGAYRLNDVGYIIMSWEDAQPINHVWSGASEEEKQEIIDQLKNNVRQMRAIKGDYVGGFGRVGCIDDEFQWDGYQDEQHEYGPYDDEAAFNEGIVEALHRRSSLPKVNDPESPEYNNGFVTRELVRSLKNHEIVFTHGDLHMSNILIRKDFTVVIIDWATAGFYPEYWEFYKSTWRDPFIPSFIRQIVRYVPPYWIEANIMEQIYNKILGYRPTTQQQILDTRKSRQ